MADERLRELEREYWRAGGDVRDLLERAFEYGLIEGKEVNADPHKKLYDKLGINHAIVREHARDLVEIINEDPKIKWVYFGWHHDDVRMQAVQCGIPEKKITPEFCDNVLWNTRRKHDAGIGVNWDVLDFWIMEDKEDLLRGGK